MLKLSSPSHAACLGNIKKQCRPGSTQPNSVLNSLADPNEMALNFPLWKVDMMLGNAKPSK